LRILSAIIAAVLLSLPDLLGSKWTAAGSLDPTLQSCIILQYEQVCILDHFAIDIHSGWTRLLAAR
jgi:hypothetical protein